MTYENVKFGKDCRDKIIEGINLAANAVACTFGPNGKNAIVRNDGGLLITKDGYHTAMCVNDPDPYVSMGIDIIQDICKKTAYDVGDGPQPLYANILTPKGWKKMGEIKEGDVICGTNQTFQTVIGVFPKGKKRLYKVVLSGGREVECCEDHLWSVYKTVTQSPKLKTVPLKDIISDGLFKLSNKGYKQHRYFVPKTIVDFESNASKMPLDPFLVGLLLGDGSLTGTGSIELSLSLDQGYLLDQIKLPEGLYLHVQKVLSKHYLRVKIQGISAEGKSAKDYIRDLGLLGTTSKTKFIPEAYLYSSYADRLELLRGLEETDGHLNSKGLLEYSTISDNLKDGIIELLRSLGKSTHCWLNTRTSKSKGSYGGSTPIWRISELQGYKYGEAIIDVIDTGEEVDMQCIKVSNEDHLYITNNYVVTHNTSTSAILAAKLINTFKDYENPIAVMRELKDKVTQVIDSIEGTVMSCTTRSDFFKVAKVSTNGDEEIANLVADAFDQVGKDGIVMFEESEAVKDTVEYSQGFRIESGYASPYYINTGKKTCELENVLVYISDTKIEEVKMVLELAKKARDNKQSLLLIAPEYDSEIHVFLNQNKSQLQSCAVYSPNRGAYRQMMLEDLKEIFNTTKVIKKVIVTNKTTTFVDEFKISEETINKTREFLTNPQLPELDRKFHEKRLANFTGKLATIYVGGFSKLEMKERFDRVEDAVCAVRAAREGGMVIGGGLALYNAVTPVESDNESFKFDDESNTVQQFSDDFISVMQYPSQLLGTQDDYQIYTQCGRHPSKFIGASLMNQGIYEPFLVVKTVLENAISTAALVLTTDVAILNFNNFLMN